MSWTFTTLKTAIQDYTQNTESTFVTNLPTLIVQAENRIIKSVELPNFRQNVTGTLTSGNPYLSTPSDYLYPFSLAVLDSSNNYDYLLNKDVSFIREAYPTASTTGSPKFYAQFDDDTFIVAPAPDANLLYASLVEAYTFMKGEPDIMANYEKRFEEALQRLTLESDGYNRKDAFRDGYRKINV